MTEDIQIEYKILATALLSDIETRNKIFSVVTPQYFKDDTARSIFICFRSAYEKYPNADDSALVNALNSQEQRSLMTSALQNMMSPKIAKNTLDDTLQLFRDSYIRRTLSESISELSVSDNIGIDSVRQLYENAEQLTANRKINSAEKYLAEYNRQVEYIPTGFPELDELLNGGFITGTLSTIGARPSTGKTTFAINIAANDPNIKTLIVSIEMSATMIYDRLISDKAEIDYSLAGLHKVNFETVRSVIGSYPNLQIADNISAVEDIINLIYSEKPKLVIIDFVQIITSKQKFVDNRQRIDYISQTLKTAAKKTGCCIVTLSQVTRSGKDKPTMSDLKESGGLEQDCDYIILLHREYVNDKSGKVKPNETTVTLDKNKFGNTNELKFDFDGKYQRFTTENSIVRPTNGEVTADDDLPF